MIWPFERRWRPRDPAPLDGTLVSRTVARWDHERVRVRGASDQELGALGRLDVTVPPPLRELLASSNGTNDMDRGYLRLWSTHEIIGRHVPGSPLAFGDPLIRSFEYALTSDGHVVVLGDGAPQPLARDFAHFLELALADDERLLGSTG